MGKRKRTQIDLPVGDPTLNVKNLLIAAQKRMDDLRAAENKRMDDLRAAEALRIDEGLRNREHHLEAMAELRASYQEKLAEAETARRTVESARASDQASVLASQVASAAEAMRESVASTAAAMATQLAATTGAITDRLSLVEKAQYEGAGKERATDPMMATLLQEVRGLGEYRAQTQGGASAHSVSIVQTIALAGVVLSLISTGVGFLGLIVMAIHLFTGK